MLGVGCWKHIPGHRVGCCELGAVSYFQKRDIGSSVLEVGSCIKMPQEVGWSCQSTGLGRPHVGALPGSRYPGTTRLLPKSAVPFPGGISGLAPCRAWLGGTQSLICTVLVSHKGGAVLMVTDVLPQSLRPGCLIPSPKLRMVRMVPLNNHSTSRAGDAQC